MVEVGVVRWHWGWGGDVVTINTGDDDGGLLMMLEMGVVMSLPLTQVVVAVAMTVVGCRCRH